MEENQGKRQPSDLTRINFTEKWEVTFWEQELGATEVRLRQAIALLGNQADKVRDHLKRTRVRFPRARNG